MESNLTEAGQRALDEVKELLEQADEEWVDVIREVTEAHNRKGADYGDDEDPYANCTACEDLGVPPWIGVTIRIRDKEKRIDAFCQRGELANESVEDSLWDAAVYNLIRYLLYRREQYPNVIDVEFEELADTRVEIPPAPWWEDFDAFQRCVDALLYVVDPSSSFYKFWKDEYAGYGRETLDDLWREFHLREANAD